MLPSFEIYLSILTDSWMPWLMENRRQEKFESLIRLTGSAFQDNYRDFFPSMLQSFKKLNLIASKKIIAEFDYFATLNMSSAGKQMALALSTQPVQNYREHFYNRITGMCLGAGYDALNLFFRQCEGPEIKAYYLEKILADIHSMLVIPLPEKNISGEEIKIAIQVKLALAILYQTLLKKQGNTDNSMLSCFDTRGWLKITLQQVQSVGDSENLLMIFDRLTGEDLPLAKSKQHVVPENAFCFQKNETRVEDAISIPDLVSDLKQDYNEFKQVIVGFFGSEKLQKKSEVHAEKWLLSKEVCALMRISKSTLQRRRNSGEIKCYKFGGKYRYEEQYIRQLMRANESNQSSSEKIKK